MAKFCKWILLSFFVLFVNMDCKAQLSPADSTLFNAAFTSNVYISYWAFPYPWYTYDSITSTQNLEDRFYNSFPFTPGDVNNDTYNNINNSDLSLVPEINASFNLMPWIYGQTDPVMKLPFTLNGKDDTTYTAYTPGLVNGSCKTGFLLIHGNGVNTTSLLLQGIGYAATYCHVKNTCMQYGDVYSYCKPNEDWRAIYWNRKKLGEYVYNYCEAIGHNYGTNYLIETIALVKSLKSKYDRVIVMGISEGGYTTLLNLLNSEPDGAVISGGYSIDFDTYLPSQFIMSNRFGNAPQVYNRDTVKARISELQTNTLFTWGENDAVPLMDPEHDFHYTENFLNNYDKCSFFYDFSTHTFPPCNTLDTFIQRIIAKPKAFIIPIDTVCISDSAQIRIKICGQAPFQFDLYKDNALLTTLNSNSDTTIFTLYTEGKYQVKNITDATNNPCFNSNVYSYSKDAAVSFAVTGKYFNCDSNHTEIGLQLSGTSPWYLNSTLDGIAVNDTFTNAAITKIYNNVDINYLQISDSNHCTVLLNQFIPAKDSVTDVNLSPPVFDCDSGKTKIAFALQGRSPWVLEYKKNGIPDSALIASTTIDLYFDNGLYEFLAVTDSNQCQKVINQVYTFNSDSLGIFVSIPLYNCDSNKTQIQFDLQGNPPFDIHYTQDGNPMTINTNNASITQYFESGIYVFLDVSDATGCVKNINQNFNFSYNPINYSMSVPQFDCDSNLTRIHFDLEGNAPWTIDYTKGGNAQQVVSNTDSIDLFLDNDIYQFIQLSDANCSKNINQSFLFNYDSIGVQLSMPLYNCDSNKTRIQFDLQGNPPFDIHYTKDGNPLLISTNNASLTQYFSNGDYVFLDATDATGCVKGINLNFNFNYYPVNYTLSVPQYNCDSNRTFVHFDLQGNAPWTINYTLDGDPLQIVTNTDSTDLFFGNGIYQFIQLTDASCAININQSFVFNYDSIAIQLSTPAYSCDSGTAQIQFDMQGNPPFDIHYTKNGNPQLISTSNTSITQFFENGYYEFLDVTDATGCVKNINQNFNLLFNALSYVLNVPQYDCDSNKTFIHFDLQGNPPWKIGYTRDGNPQQVISNTGSIDLFLSNGIYQFIKVSDASCVKYINQSFVFNKDSIGVQLSPPFYSCDSAKTQIQFDLQGNPPFDIHYTKDGNPLVISTSNAISVQYFSNGNYVFLDVSDATGCVENISQNFSFNYDTINYAMSVPQYNCDSNKTFIHFDLQGNTPWVIDYSMNGTPLQIVSNANNIDLFLDNGNYQFMQVTDATNCTKNINQSFSFNYNPLSVLITQQKFDCDSNKYKIDFMLQGNSPWTIEYNDGIVYSSYISFSPSPSLLLANGNWVISKIKDATNCEYNLNYPVNVNFTPLTVAATVPLYDCDSNKSRVNFTLTGNAPWMIHYTEQNLMQSDSVQTYDPNFILYFTNGLYLITQVTDSTHCAFDLMLSVNNFYTPLSYQQNPRMYNCDSTKMRIDYSFTGDAPYTLSYKDNITGIITQINSMLPSATFYLGDGDYTVLSVHDLKCTQIINDTIHIYYPKLNSTLLPALVSCDSDKVYVRFSTPQGNPPYTYYYYFNNQYLNFSTYSNLTTLYLNNGQYFFEKVTDSMGCSVMYNQAVNAYYVPYQYNGFVKKYICEKDSTELTFNVSVFTKTFIAYTFNGGAIDSFLITPNSSKAFLLPDGDYEILYISDSAGCSQNINQHIIIEEEPVEATYTISLNCDLRKYTYLFDLKGKSPWTISYHRLNLPYTEIAYDTPFSWDADAGMYYIAQITDSNGCRFDIQKTDTLKAFLSDYPTLYYRDYTLHTINTPHRYYWYKDEALIDTVSKGSIPSYGNGIYKVLIVDDLGCYNWSNELTLGYPADINVFPNPVSTITNIVVNDHFGESWQYQLFDMSGKLLEEKSLTIPSAQVDMSHYEAGVYSVVIRYSNQGSNQKHVIRLLRN